MLRVGKLEHQIDGADEREVLTVKEVCVLFGVSRMTLWKWRRGLSKRKKIPHRELTYGSRKLIVFYRDELDAWAKRNEVMYADERQAMHEEWENVRRIERSQMRPHKVARHYERKIPRVKRVKRIRRDDS